MSATVDLLTTAARLGRCRAVELSLFRALGARSVVEADPDASCFLAGAARSAAWRARELEVLLPVSLGLPGVEECTMSPGPELDATLAEAAGTELATDSLLSGLADALFPAMLSAYRAHLLACSPAADAPVARTLRRVIVDVEATTDEVLALVPDRVAATPDFARRIAGAVDSVGGIFGPLE